jgi:hypothetical protein
MRFAVLGISAALALLSGPRCLAETVDEKIKKQIAAGAIEVKTQDHTRDACDRGNNITITSTTDGDVVLKPGEEKYFKIDKDKDDYTRSGGWYWKCGNTPEKARIKGATYIKAIRKENGVVDWYWVLVELK